MQNRFVFVNKTTGRSSDPAMVEGKKEGCAPKTTGPTCSVCKNGFAPQGPLQECLPCEAERAENSYYLAYGFLAGMCCFWIACTTYFLSRRPNIEHQILYDVSDIMHSVRRRQVLERARHTFLKMTGNKKGELKNEESKMKNEKNGKIVQADKNLTTSDQKVGKMKRLHRYCKKLAVKGSTGRRLKIMISWTQISVNFNSMFDIPWPQSMIAAWDALRALVSFDFLGITTGVFCGVDDSFLTTFKLHMLIVPTIAVLTLLSLFIVIIVRCCLKSWKSRFSISDAWNRCVQVLNFIAFMLFPGICTKVFFVSKCRLFSPTEKAQFWLHARDYRIICYEGEHAEVQTLSFICMFVYVLAYPGWLWWSLYSHRHLIMHREQIEQQHLERCQQGQIFTKYKHLWNAQDYIALVHYRSKYGQLFVYYKWNRWYFEFIELTRKILMCGGLVLFAPGSMSQVAVAVLLCTVYYVFAVNMDPMDSKLDNYLNQAASLQIILTLIIGMLLKASASDTEAFTKYELFVFNFILVFMWFAVLSLGIITVVLSIPWTDIFGYREEMKKRKKKVKKKRELQRRQEKSQLTKIKHTKTGQQNAKTYILKAHKALEVRKQGQRRAIIKRKSKSAEKAKIRLWHKTTFKTQTTLSNKPIEIVPSTFSKMKQEYTGQNVEATVNDIETQHQMHRNLAVQRIKKRQSLHQDSILVRVAARKKIKHSKALSKSKYFSSLNATSISKIIDAMDIVVFDQYDNSDICRQGDTAEKFYVIVSGACQVLIDGQPIAVLNDLDIFGENALFTGANGRSIRSATVTKMVGKDLQLLALTRGKFNALLASGTFTDGCMATLKQVADIRKKPNRPKKRQNNFFFETEKGVDKKKTSVQKTKVQPKPKVQTKAQLDVGSSPAAMGGGGQSSVMQRKSMSDNQKRTAVEVIRTQILKAVPPNKLYKTFQRLCKQEKTDGLTKKMFLDLIASVRSHLKEEQKMTPIVELAWEAAWAPAETGGELSYEMLYHWLKPSIKRVPTHQEEHTSHLDLTTLRESLKACGRNENLAESILLGYDRDHDGGISLSEFQEWLTCTDDK